MSQKRKEMSRSRSDEHDSEGPDSPTSDGETTQPIPRGATKKENEQQPGGQAERPDASAISEEQDIERRPKRKYVRGGRKKLKVVSSLLESHLPECLATNENERHLFYARVIALPEVVTAGVTREEVLSWYKRARKKVRISQLKAETMVGYTLHYWGPSFKGRGEFVRLLFEAAGITYSENNDGRSIQAGCDLSQGDGVGTGYPYPAKSPPVVTGPDGFNCSQTPAILWSLGKRFGLYPEDEKDEVAGLAVNCTVADLIAEGRLAFHAAEPTGPYSSQREQTEPRVKWFERERLPYWLRHLEHCLSSAKDRGKSFYFGGKLTYVDLAVFHALNASEAQFPAAWAALKQQGKIPLLVAFKTRVAQVPNIAAYLASDRARPWAGDSMM